MGQDIDALTNRFDQSLVILMQNLGPQLIVRTQVGLTPGQVFMLHFIRQESKCSVSNLAEKMEVAPSAITVMLDRLENHGFVRRTRDKADRRVVLIELTALGEQRLSEVLHLRNQVIKHCLTQMGLNELDSFIRGLEKLASIAQTTDLQAIIGSCKEE
ncbi:MarR family winged helix-turn-helix transcriptional regulator [Alicyclobacillus mengziensis]|uniref:MarR family transcriptional regulator n=1 Tax=Alicyclobacillus mengziensis TaxID=2931921 RepID=A0A9X7Z545_9BACL|nr:MarR family transcriptional regulator [Alicyclobacillus mengziensis]QSO46579.1 MarR family transcriptional regulator [Alicyclobacillus mengziensis]